MLQLVQSNVQAPESSITRPAGGHFSDFAFSNIETAKPEKFAAEREGGLKGRLQARLPATRKAKAEGRAQLALRS